MNKFVANSRNTIWELKNNELRLSIYKIVGIGEELFFSSYRLGIKDMSLETNDFDEAVSKAKQIVREKIDKLYLDAYSFINDEEYKIERW